MALSPLAGKPAPKDMLVDLSRLEKEYFERRPDPDNPAQRVSFGTSGHRGSSLRGSFNEAHILAITQAICDYRQSRDIDGPLYLGKDTHVLSRPAQRTAVKLRPHPETEDGSRMRRASPWYFTTGERKDAAGCDEARPSASTACWATMGFRLRRR